MIRKLVSGKYRLYSRKLPPSGGIQGDQLVRESIESAGLTVYFMTGVPVDGPILVV